MFILRFPQFLGRWHRWQYAPNRRLQRSAGCHLLDYSQHSARGPRPLNGRVMRCSRAIDMASIKEWFIAAAALCISTVSFAGTAGGVVEMREACSVGRAIGPHVTTLAFYENGEVEFSVAANLKYRATISEKRVGSICSGLLRPLAEETEGLRTLVQKQNDTEMYYVTLPGRSSEFPRLSFREGVERDGMPSGTIDDPLSPRVKELLREIDNVASDLFEPRYEHLLEDCDERAVPSATH